MDRFLPKVKMGHRRLKEPANDTSSAANTTSSYIGVGARSGNYSPPRGLKDVLSSETTTNEVRSYLDLINEENDATAIVLRLDLVLACRKLQRLIHGGDSLPLQHAAYTDAVTDNQT